MMLPALKNRFYGSLAALCLFSGSFIVSCANDNEEDLYPEKVTCDTSAVTYALTVQPVLQRSCTGCHSAASPAGGVVLASYPEVKKHADNGRLVGAISHAAGYIPMPLGGGKLPDCDIAGITKWVQNGAPNN